MAEMLDLARKLAYRTTAYELWQKKVDKIMLKTNTEKIGILIFFV